jgi:two-component system, OmpR family, sensor histidine kinase MprB
MKPPSFHYRRSLASRVILLTTIAVGLAVAFLSAGAYFTVRMQLQSTLDESLLDRAHRAADSPALQQLTTDYEIPSWMLGAADVRIAFITSSRSIFTPDRETPFPVLGEPELAVAAGERPSSIRTISAGGTRYRVVTVPTAQSGQALVIAQSLEPQEQLLAQLGVVMLLFGLAGVIAAGVAGWTVARNGLRPVRRLTTAVEENARTEDLHPLRVEGDDEVARLTIAFNQMLAALAASRDRQRRLVADAGHELRTPLTSLRTNLDLLAQADGSPDLSREARAELLGDVRAQIEELTTLIGDLVELAREEPMAHVVEPVDLAEVVDRAVARVRLRAPGIGFDVKADPWWIIGESSALERALTNLLDNAAKWSPPEGVVTVRIADGELTVDDEGDGISDADLPHVFDRFYRAEESRSMPGSGLGLSIVRQVVERHSGTVTAGRCPSGGSRFTVLLPGSPTPPDRVADHHEILEQRGPTTSQHAKT